VDGVGKQGDRSGDQHHDELSDRGEAKSDQADLDRPDPPALASSAESTESAASWLCGRKSDSTKPFMPLGC
jgi:hypothetical protein